MLSVTKYLCNIKHLSAILRGVREMSPRLECCYPEYRLCGEHESRLRRVTNFHSMVTNVQLSLTSLLTRHSLGSRPSATDCGGGGAISPPPHTHTHISRSSRRGETGEAASVESSCRDAPNPCLTLTLGSHVGSSKAKDKNAAFSHLDGPQSPNLPKVQQRMVLNEQKK